MRAAECYWCADCRQFGPNAQRVAEEEARCARIQTPAANPSLSTFSMRLLPSVGHEQAAPRSAICQASKRRLTPPPASMPIAMSTELIFCKMASFHSLFNFRRDDLIGF